MLHRLGPEKQPFAPEIDYQRMNDDRHEKWNVVTHDGGVGEQTPENSYQVSILDVTHVQLNTSTEEVNSKYRLN